MNIDNTASSSLDVSWDPVVDATSYDVSWSESGSSVVLDSQSVNDNAVTISQLLPHTTYVVTVSAKGTNSKLLAEGSVSGTTDEGSKSMWCVGCVWEEGTVNLLQQVPPLILYVS